MKKELSHVEPDVPPKNLWTLICAFLQEHQISVCVCFGMVGFILSSTLLTRGGHNHLSPYGGLIIENKVSLYNEMLERRADTIGDSLKRLSVRKTSSSDFKVADKDKMIKALKTELQRTTGEFNSMNYGRADTDLVQFNKYLFPDKKALRDSIRSAGWPPKVGFKKSVNGYVIDQSPFYRSNPSKFAVKFFLSNYKRPFMLDFMGDYPTFGLWLVLSIIQMSFWFLLIPLFTGNVLNLQKKIKSGFEITIHGILLNCIVPFLFIVAFCFVFYIFIGDDLVIRDNYFLEDFNFRMLIYAIPGYLVAAYGFGTYISLARQVDDLDTTPDTSFAENPDNITQLYLDLKVAFENAFLGTALILSLFVLWSTVTINAIESTDAILFLQELTGRRFIPSDFILLMGLLHTCILLVFYLPVKLKFNSLEVTKENQDDGNSPFRTLWKGVSENIGTLLVTTSPLLASLIQSFFNTGQA